MTYHEWGDKTVDWVGIDSCCRILSTYCKRYGRLGGQVKEKYGTVRFYVYFGVLSLHTLVYPGYGIDRFPKWLSNLDSDYISPALRYLFERPFIWWQTVIYNRAYQKCLKLYPHLRAALLCGADYPEFIKGASRREGRFHYILGWKGETIGTWVSLGEDE